MRVLVLVH